MSLLENDLLEFYADCDYWPSRSIPRRPRELYIPLILSKQSENYIEQICKTAFNGSIITPLATGDCAFLAPVLIHESLFHFYKAFYNYLAARVLYFGGMFHWLNITLYYSKFYLARSVTVLAGRHSYGINRSNLYDMSNPCFLEKVAQALANSKGKSARDSYRMKLLIDVAKKSGEMILDMGKVSSHRDVWEDYKTFDHESLGLHPLFYTTAEELLRERNEENYSFDGYMQVDFNLPVNQFRDYFERDRSIKSKANVIYDLESGGVLLAISRQYNLYAKMQVAGLPIEQEKFAYMINYCLPDSEAKKRLLSLCGEGFPTKQLFSNDGDVFYDEQDRSL